MIVNLLRSRFWCNNQTKTNLLFACDKTAVIRG